MIFSYNWLQDYLDKKLPKPEKLAQLLSAHFAEVEEVKKIGSDFVLDIDVRPNRASDCFSHWGIARECSAVIGSKIKDLALKIEESALKAKDLVEVEVKDKTACPRYTARVITDIKVGPSPKWLKERLRVCGLQPINNIVDLANYVMLETGQPLHAFDLDKLENSKTIKRLIVRFAKRGEGIITLDDQKFDLNENILVIADEKKPVAIAGIKGGKETGIDKKTKTIVLESANFAPIIGRKGSQELRLKTDASWRFEHGLDPNLTEMAINRAANLIQELGVGKMAQGMVDFYPKKVRPKTIRLEIDHVEKLLGIKVPLKEIIRILRALDFKIVQSSSSKNNPFLLIEVPTRRLDVALPEDLIEEVGRIYGYEKIPALLPKASLIPPKRNLSIFWEEFSKDVLKESGFSEVYNYSFINQQKKEVFGYKTSELIEIENPLSLEYQYLNPSLIPNLLKNVQENFRYFDQIKIFELGKIFKKEKTGVLEKRTLAGLIAQEENDEGFYLLKGSLDALFEKMAIAGYWYDEYKPTPEQSRSLIWQKARSAEIKMDSQEIGFLGEISTRVLKSLKIKGRVVLFEIDFEKLQELASEEHQYQPVSPYPSAIRDLAVLIPRNVKVADLLNVINSQGGSLVRDVDLFDIYEGEELPSGKKNLAFHIVYQAEDRTLTSGEIDKVHKKIVKSLEENPEWEVRK